jgi:uncharacterized Zn finger protein
VSGVVPPRPPTGPGDTDTGSLASPAEQASSPTWWADRWLDLLTAAGPADARRVQRGRAAARRGAVEDLEVRPGRIRARVREDRVSPYRVELRWPVPDDDAWDAAVTALAAEVRSTAALLDGQLPEEAAEVLAEVGVALVPTAGDLERTCTCTERTSWCRHVAAVHAAAGAIFARDPFLLLQLRGRTRDELLRALRATRGDTSTDPASDLDLTHGLYGARGDIDAIVLAPHPVHDPAALVLQLGDPPGVDDPRPLVRIVERAAATAWRLAAGDGAEAADEELLLAELRAQRVGSAASLAEALGRDADGVRDQLDALFEAGSVMRTGSGDRARYRAP